MISCLILLLVVVAPIEQARADVPVTHVDIIDSDGQVSPTHWRTSSTFIWSQTNLLLQTAIEIPSHLVSQLPPALQANLRGDSFHGSIHLADDHMFLVLELHAPALLFKLGNSQSLRVSAAYGETTWMRNSLCRDQNVFLTEDDGAAEKAENQKDAFFISLACKPAHGGTWVEVASSDDVSLSFEPHDQTRFRSVEHGAEFWLPNNASRRTLADLLVMGGDGEAAAHYSVEVQAPIISHQTRSAALPILVADSTATSRNDFHESVEPFQARMRPVLGVEAQLLEAHGTLDRSQTGKTQTELSLVGRLEKEISDDGSLVADLNLPIRRLGAGLDSKGAGSHLGWVNAGFSMPVRSFVTSVAFGAQASVLDVYSPDRSTATSLSPSVEARFGPLYSAVLAPFDLISHLSIVRARADLPITPDLKNRLTAQAFFGRTWIEPRSNSWNINGITLGLVGEF